MDQKSSHEPAPAFQQGRLHHLCQDWASLGIGERLTAPKNVEVMSGDWMRLRLFKLLLLTIVLVAPAFAQNGQCGFIHDNDLQSLCRAQNG
jgi:hypothetical protein